MGPWRVMQNSRIWMTIWNERLLCKDDISIVYKVMVVKRKVKKTKTEKKSG
jgi:hypothetical protein